MSLKKITIEDFAYEKFEKSYYKLDKTRDRLQFIEYRYDPLYNEVILTYLENTIHDQPYTIDIIINADGSFK